MSRLLFLIFSYASKRPKTSFLYLLACMYVVIGYIRRKKQEQKEREYFSRKPHADTPLLTFSGAGLLAFYFQGVCAYLQDHFDLTNVRFAGISAGSCSAAGLASNLPVKASIVFGLRWFQIMKSKGIYFIDPQALVDMGVQICNEFGIEESRVLYANEQENHFLGVTDITTFPWRHCAMSKFDSRRESFYAMSCSMRILPFFKTPGYMRGMFLLDGVFSAIFTIPPDQNEAKVIRITPCANPMSGIRADIQPDIYDKDEHFKIIDVFKIPSLDEILFQFEKGYKDALRNRDRLIMKGMIPKKKTTTNPFESKKNEAFEHEHTMTLQEWLTYIRMHGQKILNEIQVNPGNLFVGDVEKLRKEDFSALV